MSFDVVFDHFIGLLADSGLWFLGGAILGAALEAWLPASWAMRWLSSPRASVLHATVAGAILPGCSMTTIPLAAALQRRGARLGTLTAFIMISPILSPETIILTAAMLGGEADRSPDCFAPHRDPHHGPGPQRIRKAAREAASTATC